MFVAYYNPHPFRAFHYSASTPYFFYPQCSLTLRIVSLVRHTGPRAGASPSFQKRIFEKAPESSSGGHFVSLSHTTNHFHFVHFIIPHQRHISLTHNAHHLYALPLNSVTPALIRCLSLFFSHNVHSLYALPLLFRHTACSFGGPPSRSLSLIPKTNF